MMWIILLLFAVIILILIYDKVSINKQIRKVQKDIEESIRNDSIVHLRIHYSNFQLRELIDSMNQFMEKFQSYKEKTDFLETERKKMITNISHDIRTPLTSILGYMDVIYRENNQMSETERLKYLEVVYQKAKNLTTITESFFELAQLEAGEVKITLKRLNISYIIQDVFVSFFIEFEKNGITPEIILPDKPLYVMCDRDSVERVLNNLIHNALKYGSEGKVIGVQVQVLDGYCWIEIWDKGKGILEKDLPYVFNRLFQSERSRSNVGNGLGLSVSKKLIEEQNGQINVTSKPYEKTSFSFSLLADNGK